MSPLTLAQPDSVPETIDLDDLRDLMRSVTATTQTLQDTHEALQNQVGRLQGELAEANRQLQRSRELAVLGEMAAGIAHEIRNPLGSIQLYVQMLGEDLHDRPEQNGLCHKISRAVTGIDGIVSDVLAFARENTIHPEPIATSEVWDRALESCHALIERSGVEVLREESEPLNFYGDLRLMVQALGNVIRNAVEAMEDAGSDPRKFVVSTGQETMRCPDGVRRKRLVMAVRDTGPGITGEVEDRMFNPFFTTRSTGTGLGLAIVHRIVEGHGGHVVVSNVATDHSGPSEFSANGHLSNQQEKGGARVALCLPEGALGEQAGKHEDSDKFIDDGRDAASFHHQLITGQES